MLITIRSLSLWLTSSGCVQSSKMNDRFSAMFARLCAVPRCQRQVGLSLVCNSADAEQGFGVHLIHEEPDHTVAVLAAQLAAPPREHRLTIMALGLSFAGVDGPEKNEFLSVRTTGARAGYADLRKVGEKVCGVGDVLALPQGMIHSVWNETDAVSLSLHIYGKHINYTGRSQFDLKTQTETPFIVKMQS